MITNYPQTAERMKDKKNTTQKNNTEVEPPGERVVYSRDLSKTFRKPFRFRETKAVQKLDLDIYKNEIFGLLGPNGSGKTTTMKLLLGLLFPDEGEARVLNRDPRNVATKERIGFLPEESYLYDFLTGKETLQFFGRLFGLSREHREERVDELLREVGLWEDRNRKLSEYSKGMRRRIGFAQAIINDPEVIVLDEPTVGLDPIIARQLKDLILDLKQQGKCVIVSSHVLADVEDVCDRVAILHEGIKRKEGAVEDLLQIKDQFRTIMDRSSGEKISQEQIENFKKFLKKNGWNVRSFDHPTKTLEELFLSTIQEDSS